MARILYLTLAATFFVAGCMADGPMEGPSSTGMSNEDTAAGGGVDDDATAGEIAEPTTGL